MFTAITTFLSTWKTYLVGALVLLLMAGTAWCTHRLDSAAYKALELTYAQAAAAAASAGAAHAAALSSIGNVHAAADATAQTAIATDTTNRVREVTKYVTTYRDRTCVPYGLIRVLDAKVIGVMPDDLDLPAGQSNDSCAPISAADLAAQILQNYGAAQQNAKQLDDLNAYLREVEAWRSAH